MTTATPAICIAAPASGTGKTTIATGLIAAIARRTTVAPFKVGPDYIDPGYHTLAAKRPGRNLDSVMCGRQLIGPLYAHGSRGANIAVIEGVMGLFDGRITQDTDPTCAPGSTAEIAEILQVPVVLVVDVRGMSQSAGALVRGFATSNTNVRVAGVILNKVGTERHAAVARAAVEAVGVPVLGAVPRMTGVEVPSRHLGLVTAAEHGSEAINAVETMADLVEEHIDVDAIMQLASCGYQGPAWDPATALGEYAAEQCCPIGAGTTSSAMENPQAHRPRIALAGGPAFTFAYTEHEELLAAAGAHVVRFDPLLDALPPCDGLIIPGGFPEEHVEALAARTDLSEQIRALVAAGAPVHGECAGLLWLTATLDAHPMLGVIDTHAAMGRRLTLGYREAVALSDSVLYSAGQRVTGHEFHHTALTCQQAPGFSAAWGWRAWDNSPAAEGFVSPTVHASYLHVHPASTPQAVGRFVAAAREFATTHTTVAQH
ncbi:cobyrinate a,c-diamide synthase [Corynebacterium aquilae]|uniref:Hydrogenobyrinate a,c-diamide synthase n=1 Tax=Corynebacterium aquilae DSM 44791 TaxID=1431546 RepID=A0A1L7CGJ0_9CORY|nr:cobyrinate a,c-diamide synthase [Corynebacterium aquilae]APT84980.1 cobyrinic acid a,c-diamide synthase [Corynebacterium aquilae DSM 44791]